MGNWVLFDAWESEGKERLLHAHARGARARLSNCMSDSESLTTTPVDVRHEPGSLHSFVSSTFCKNHFAFLLRDPAS